MGLGRFRFGTRMGADMIYSHYYILGGGSEECLGSYSWRRVVVDW